MHLLQLQEIRAEVRASNPLANEFFESTEARISQDQVGRVSCHATWTSMQRGRAKSLLQRGGECSMGMLRITVALFQSGASCACPLVSSGCGQAAASDDTARCFRAHEPDSGQLQGREGYEEREIGIARYGK